MFAYRCNKIVSDGGKVIEITTTDLPLIRRVTDALDASHPIRERRMRDRSKNPMHQLSIRSVKLFTTLERYGCMSDGHLSFPTNIPSDLLNHFVRGHFDGIGSTYWGNGYLFFRVTERRRFLEDWVDRIKPVLKCVIKDGNISPYVLCSSDKKSKTFRNWLYDGATIWSPRKKEIFFKDDEKAA